MNDKKSALAVALLTTAILFPLFCLVLPVRATSQTNGPAPLLSHPSPAPGSVFVHTALGGFILGYDIDRTGTEGLLSEALTLPDGSHNVAVETFDQKTGKTIKIIKQLSNSQNDFVTWGIFGKNVGLVEFEHTKNGFVDKRLYGTLDPVNANKFTGRWTPPLKKDEIIAVVAPSQGVANTAVFAFENGGSNQSVVFSSNVAANTFGPRITLDDPIFDFNFSPVMAYDSATNQAILGSGNGCPNCSPVIGIVDLTTGEQTEFTGLGFGLINGIAVDPVKGIACTTTEIDFSVEFYDLATHTGIIVQLPGATSQAQRGQDVEFDPIHKVFLIGQEFSSTAPSGSSIQIFDEQGNFLESVNGLSLPASSALIALHPSKRAGYVIVTPELTELQSFTY
ncbi:MAG: hypothetical protein LAO09_05415 [Acidobacteriia bacterium]|nr:hypothetical protein [Terriglobia bacterium]